MNDQPVEISLVISDLGSGGAQRVLTNLAHAWTAAGRRVCVITLASPESDFFPLDPTIRRIGIGGLKTSSNLLSALLTNWKRICGLRSALRESGAPIAVSFVGTTNILTVLASVGLNIRIVISERNDPAIQSLGFVWDILRRVFYRFADVVTANSRGALKPLSTFVPQHKLAYVPNLLTAPPMEEIQILPEPAILAVGRLHPQKAYDVLLDAFAEIAPRFQDWRLAILGDGPLKETLHQQAERLNLSSSIDWLGRAANPFPFYRSSKIFVMPSRYEGTPNALLEAMSCGLPVVVSDASPGPLEYVEHEVSGLVVPVNNSKALADAILRIISDSELRRRLGAAARERVAECDPGKGLSIWEKVVGLIAEP